MDVAGAKVVLLRHRDGGADTLLGWLRPYRGLDSRHLVEILQALLAAAPALNGPVADRELVYALWDLCRTARNWTRGPPDPNFHGRHFIPPDDKRRLDGWIDEIEAVTLHLLAGQPASVAFLGLPWNVLEWELGPRAAFLVPLFREMLREYAADESDGEDEVVLCRALASMGPAAAAAVPEVAAAAERSRYPEVRAAAGEALRAIGGAAAGSP